MNRPHQTQRLLLLALVALPLLLGGCRVKGALEGARDRYRFHTRVQDRHGTIRHEGAIARGSTLDLAAGERTEPGAEDYWIPVRQLRKEETCLREYLTTEPEALVPLLETPEQASVAYLASGRVVLHTERSGRVTVGWQGRECILEQTHFQVVEAAALRLGDAGLLALEDHPGDLLGEPWIDEAAGSVLRLLPGTLARLEVTVHDAAGAELAYADDFLTIDAGGLDVRLVDHELLVDARRATPGRRYPLQITTPGGLRLERELEILEPGELGSLALRHYWVPRLGGVGLKAGATTYEGEPILQPPVEWRSPELLAHRVEGRLAFAGRQDLVALIPDAGAQPTEVSAARVGLGGLEATALLPPGLWVPAPAEPVEVGCQSAGGRGPVSTGLALLLLAGLALVSFRRTGE
ncbi:MAG: hypothetical protein P1V51_15210 [Deltaproteobacteria bacterium]|nr:hypothetical protein [Deltaproteobacteria bacterium]